MGAWLKNIFVFIWRLFSAYIRMHLKPFQGLTGSTPRYTHGGHTQKYSRWVYTEVVTLDTQRSIHGGNTQKYSQWAHKKVLTGGTHKNNHGEHIQKCSQWAHIEVFTVSIFILNYIHIYSHTYNIFISHMPTHYAHTHTSVHAKTHLWASWLDACFRY